MSVAEARDRTLLTSDIVTFLSVRTLGDPRAMHRAWRFKGGNPYHYTRPASESPISAQSTSSVLYLLLGICAGLISGGILVGWWIRTALPPVSPELIVALATLGLAVATVATVAFEIRRERRNRLPNLSFIPPSQGRGIRILNLGPGIASNVAVTIFKYPATDEVARARRERQLNESSIGADRTDMLKVGAEWEPQIGTPSTDDYVELQVYGHNVFGEPARNLSATLVGAQFNREYRNIAQGTVSSVEWTEVVPKEAIRRRREAEKSFKGYMAKTQAQVARHRETQSNQSS